MHYSNGIVLLKVLHTTSSKANASLLHNNSAIEHSVGIKCDLKWDFYFKGLTLFDMGDRA